MFVITKNGIPITKLSPLKDSAIELKALSQEMKKARTAKQAITQDEIQQWKHEGHSH